MITRKLASILEDSTELGAIVAHARRDEALRQAFQEILPPELAASCRSSVTGAGVLFIVAENGAVAAKLRQLSTRLLLGVKRRGFDCTATKVEAQADRRMPRARPRSPQPLPRDTVELLAKTAATVDPASPLSAALTRMARRHAARLERSLQNVEQHEQDSCHQRKP